MVLGSDRETVWVMVKAAKVIFFPSNIELLHLSLYSNYQKYIFDTYVRIICCFTCFRKYRKTLRAEHMNVSLVTQHGTISGKVSLYLYLLTS